MNVKVEGPPFVGEKLGRIRAFQRRRLRRIAEHPRLDVEPHPEVELSRQMPLTVMARNADGAISGLLRGGAVVTHAFAGVLQVSRDGRPVGLLGDTNDGFGPSVDGIYVRDDATGDFYGIEIREDPIGRPWLGRTDIMSLPGRLVVAGLVDQPGQPRLQRFAYTRETDAFEGSEEAGNWTHQIQRFRSGNEAIDQLVMTSR